MVLHFCVSSKNKDKFICFKKKQNCMNISDLLLDQELCKDIENAYRKYKHHVYRDTTFSLLREQLAYFESNSDLDFEFRELAKVIRGQNIENRNLDRWINGDEGIDFWLLPKSINNTTPLSDTFLTNQTVVENIEIKKEFALIKAAIHLHIISILWIMEGGFYLENAMKIKPSGNKLQLNEEKNRLLKGFSLFKPYYKLYQSWRDNAFEKATQLIEEEKNVLILSLDVKDYYPSMKVDFDKIKEEVNEWQTKNKKEVYRFNFLTDVLEKIQKEFERVIKNHKVRESYGLPIGLISSGVIANWYMNKFDEKVHEIINPSYYGRYVDDILMVIPNPKIPKKEVVEKICQEEKSNFIKKEIFKWYFERPNDEIIKYRGDNNTYQILLFENSDDNTLCFQDEKIKFIYFDHTEPIALLHKFQKELKKESSEFRLLPEDININDEFYSEAHFLAFDGSMNKLRNVTGFGVDLFGASKFLAKKIYSALQSDREPDAVASKQILTFFKGARAIESSKLWEKVATYFIATKDKKGLIKFIKNVRIAISNISNKTTTCLNNTSYYQPKGKSFGLFINNPTIEDKKYPHTELIRESLENSLFASVCMAMALEGVINLNYGKNVEEGEQNQPEYSLSDEKIKNALRRDRDIDELILAYRKSNLIRHNFIKLPLINYTEFENNGKNSNINYLNVDLIPNQVEKKQYEIFKLDEKKLKYSPRYIHFHEIALSEFRQQLLSKSEFFRKGELGSISFEEEAKEGKALGYIDKAKIEFENANKFISTKFNIKFAYKSFIKADSTGGAKTVIKKISIDSSNKKDTFKVGLVNLKLDGKHIKESYLKNPVFDKKRKEEINHLLNLIEKETWRHGKLDMIVLPEVSIPYKALTWLCQYALQHEIVMVFGLEHWIVNNVAFNFMVTLLPFKIKDDDENIDGYKALLPVFRIKNHYSHQEKAILESYRYKIPEPFPSEYHIFDWKGINFATFNCFELANIKHRALFRDEVDLIVACENNRDVNYFSNIVESSVRDLHCFVIQANNSAYGDTRITKPIMSAAMDQVKIKGGKNAVVLIDEIDIKGLRDFQIQEYLSENKEYKPTPPGFDKTKVMKRRGKNLNE
jgi:hypothetical protein